MEGEDGCSGRTLIGFQGLKVAQGASRGPRILRPQGVVVVGGGGISVIIVIIVIVSIFATTAIVIGVIVLICASSWHGEGASKSRIADAAGRREQRTWKIVAMIMMVAGGRSGPPWTGGSGTKPSKSYGMPIPSSL